MEHLISELHYYLREKLWHHAIEISTEELKKGKDPYISFWRAYAHSQEGSLIESIRDCESIESYPDFKYSSTVALIKYHSMYAEPDNVKIEKLLEKQIGLEGQASISDLVTSLRFYSYIGDEERFGEILDKLKSMDAKEEGEELLAKGWYCAMGNKSDKWKRGTAYFEKYVKEYGNENLDAIFGGLKCFERERRYEEILDTYTEVIKTNNTFVPFHIERVKIYLLKNDYDNASDYIKQRFSKDKYFEWYKILALCNLMNEGDFKECVNNIKKMWSLMLAQEPKNPELYYKTAKLFSRTCDKNKEILALAEEMIDKALEFNSRDANYQIEKAYFRLYNNEIETAIELFTKASEIDVANRGSTIGLLYCKVLQGKFKEAKEDISFLKEMNNQSPRTSYLFKMNLFEAIIKMNENQREDKILLSIKEALKAYIEMNKATYCWNKYDSIISNEYDFLYDMAKVLLDLYSFETKINLNNIPEAIKQAQRILMLLKKNKYMSSAHLLFAKLHYLQSDTKSAMTECNEVIKIDNKNLEALMMKALICNEIHDYSNAKEVLNDAMISNLAATKESAAFLVLKSKCELGLNDTENAQKSLNAAIAVFDSSLVDPDPTRPSLFKLKKSDKLDLMKINIDILLKLGQTEEAQSFMNKLVTEFQDLGDELYMLHSDLALKTDDVKKAVNLLRKVGDKDEKLFKKSRIKLSEIYINKIMDRRLYMYCYNEILEKFPSFDNLKLAAHAIMEIDSPNEAVEIYKRALKIKQDMEVMRDLGRALIKTHDYQEAIKYYLEVNNISDAAINNQNVLYFWEMCADYIDLMYLLCNNDKVNAKKVAKLKEQIEAYLKKLSTHLKKYEDYKLKAIFAKFKYIQGKVFKEIYLEDNTSIDKKEIFKALDDSLQVEKEVSVRCKELKIDSMIKESKNLLSLIWGDIGAYYNSIDTQLNYCEKAYIESVNNDNTNIDSLNALSNLYMKKENYNDAQQYIDLLLKEDESNEDAITLLISVLNAKKSNEGAISYLESAIQKQPNAYHLIELYIEISRRNGTLSNAKDILHKSERNLRFTYTPGLYYCKGLFYKYMGEINKALIEFTKAKTDEDYGTKCLEQMLEIYINPDCDILLIDLDLPWNIKEGPGLINYYTDGLNIEAISFLLREIKVRRDDERTKVYETYVAIVTKNEEKIKEKISELLDILNKNKDNLPAWVALIMANLVIKDIKEVKAHLKIMDKITLNIKFYTDYERGYLILAYLMMMTDNMKKAEEYLRKVLGLNVAQIKAYEFLAMIKDKQEKYQESCSYYEKAWEYSNKNNANIGYKLAISFINSRQYVQSLNICNDIKRKFPDYPIDEIALQAKNGLNS